MKLYVIRHGQSETNLARKFTGWCQVPLTQQGVEDAVKIRPVLENIKFDRIFSSDLIRAMQTAEAALPGCSYETLPMIREIKMGTLEMMPIDAAVQLIAEKKVGSVGYGVFGGEDFLPFRERIAGFLDMVKGLDCENVVAFAHGGLLTTMLSIVLDRSLPHGCVCCENCTVAVFDIKNDKWRLHSWINP